MPTKIGQQRGEKTPPAAPQATEDKPKRPASSGVEPSAEAQRTHAPSEVGGKETTPAARVTQPAPRNESYLS